MAESGGCAMPRVSRLRADPRVRNENLYEFRICQTVENRKNEGRPRRQALKTR